MIQSLDTDACLDAQLSDLYHHKIFASVDSFRQVDAATTAYAQ
jgi:hypothetical protein